MSSSRLAIAALLALAVAAPAVAKKPDAAPAADTGTKFESKNLSKAILPQLQAAQKAEQTGDLAGALTSVRAAEAVGNLNTTDTFYIANAKLGIAQKTKDNALLEEALKAMVDSPFLPAAEKPKVLHNLAATDLGKNDYDGATKYFAQLAALPNASPDDMETLGELYAKQKQTAQAYDTLFKAIAAYTAAGQPVPERTYQRRLQIVYDAKVPQQIEAASYDLVKAYPTPMNWRNVLLIARDNQKMDDQANLDFFRLIDTVGGLAGERDYAEYVETAIARGLPGEAKAALSEGLSKGTLNTSKQYVGEYNKSITSKLAADKAGLPAIDKEARAATTGKTALGQGDAYYGYGEYAKAAEMYRLALAKGGVDTSTANLRLGASLARSGDKAGATAAFANVTAAPRATLAKYWTVWVGQKA